MIDKDKKVYLNGVLIGWVKDDIYYSIRSAKIHYLRVRQGYGISVSILKELKDAGVKKIIIIEKDRKDGKEERYQTYLSDYDHTESYKLSIYDEQKCIPLRRMKRCES